MDIKEILYFVYKAIELLIIPACYFAWKIDKKLTKVITAMILCDSCYYNKLKEKGDK